MLTVQLVSKKTQFNMKAFVVFSVLVIASTAHCFGLRSQGQQHSFNASHLAKSEGYPVQTFTVQTKDGYQLEVTRIPGPENYKESFERKIREGQRVRTDKPVALLMHGIFADSSEYLINSENSIAYMLVQKGFDVFLGNFRGVRNQDQSHSLLNHKKDRVFWDFCFNDMGTKDLPSIIDAVTKMTGQEKIYFIGFNQATTAFYVMSSAMPSYTERIEKMVALGPVAFMKHSTHPMMRLIADNYNSESWISKHLGEHEFKPSDSMIDIITDRCMSKNGDSTLCQNMYFVMNAFSQKYDTTEAKRISQAYPTRASTQELLHYAQLIKSGKFGPFSENGQDSQENDDGEYDLKKVTVPVIIVSVEDDMLSNQRDVNTLAEQLPNVVEHIKVTNYKCNLDLLLATDVKTTVYERVFEKLQSQKQ